MTKDIKTRVQQRMKDLDISVLELERQTNIKSARIYKWYKEGTNPKHEDSVILEKWLEETKNLEKVPHETSGKSFTEKLREKKLYETNQSIPIFEDAPFTLTNTESYRDSHIDKPDFWVTIPGLRKCNYGCRATGDSMHPLIRNHALVVGEEITDLSFILFGEVYIVQSKNNQETVKYIHPDPDNVERFLLVPYNKKAQTTPIMKKDILKLFRAKAVFNVL